MPPRIRTNTLAGFPALARSAALDPALLLREVGLEPADLDVADRWLPAVPAARLLELSARRSGCEDFALRLATGRPLGTLGPLSVVLREEPDLRSAVRLLVQYGQTYGEALHLLLLESADQVLIEVTLEFGEPAPRDQTLDLAMAALVNVVRTLVGEDWTPRAARFARPPPADPGPWRQLFGPRVDFAEDCTGLVLPAWDLDLPVIASDPSLRGYARQFLRTMVDAPTPVPLPPADVSRALEVLLPLGRQSMAGTSRLLGVSPATLRRSLAEHEQTFSAVLDATRARLAERHLANERTSLTEVSLLLGFSAPSAFSRWFHQRFGTSATEWRRAARGGGPPRTTVRGG